MKSLRIQVVEANPHLRTLLSWNLRKEGYQVASCGSYQQAQASLQKQQAHLLVLDRDLPDDAGIALCEWAYRELDVSILMLSERDTEQDEVAALRAGADDYLTKPMSVQIFSARIAALSRRLQRSTPPSSLNYGAVKIDLVQRQVTVAESAIELTPQEFSLLFVLAQSASKPVSRADLLRRAWPDAIDNPRTVDTHVLSLRKKLEHDPRQPRLIQTVRNVGYKFQPEAAERRVAEPPPTSLRPLTLPPIAEKMAIAPPSASYVAR
ncbi:MAG: response regulator transcription factor [Cyanobacteria bacterium P01_D01_bin.123]